MPSVMPPILLVRLRTLDGVEPRPYVLLTCTVSIDGCLDDLSDRRLILSTPGHFNHVDEIRAGCDAILVGAGTVRKDDPRLVVRSPARRAARQARGLPPSPLKVTITGAGALPPEARFFTLGEAGKLVYCASAAVPGTRERLGHLATVVDAGQPVHLSSVLAHLHGRGVRRLLVEGGEIVLTAFLHAGVVDELEVAVAPFVVGEPGAPRLTGSGRLPSRDGDRAVLADVRRVDDLVLLRYGLSPRFEGRLDRY
jgi:5-amino-6-(5-phosphoribosylamino)uracil reductase